MRVRIYGLVVLLVISGCATRIPVTYLYPKPMLTVERQTALQNVFLLIHREGAASPAFRQTAMHEIIQQDPIQLPASMLASLLQRQLTERGGRIMAWRVAAEGDNAFVDELKPSAIWHITLSAPVLTQTEESQEVENNGKKQMVQSWKTKVAIRIHSRLLTVPAGTVLADREFKKEKQEAYSNDGGTDLPKRYDDLLAPLAKPLAMSMVDDVSGYAPVIRYRTVQTYRQDESSSKATAAANRGHWEEAEALWKDRVSRDSGRWKDWMNLGIAAERRRQVTEARMFYEKARDCAGTAKEAASITWAAIFADLDQRLPGTLLAPDAGATWFGMRLAVLPFSDYSTSIDGPLFVRKLAYAALKAGGCNVMDLEETDKLLRQHGFSQGGQLKMTTPENVAAWLKADVVLFGDLEKFSEITLGFYGQKSISGTFKIWSAVKKEFIWQNQLDVTRHSAVSSLKQAGWAAIGQLLGSWSDKASHTPMSDASMYFVNQMLESWPRRP